jgi:hypothetical protein
MDNGYIYSKDDVRSPFVKPPWLPYTTIKCNKPRTNDNPQNLKLKNNLLTKSIVYLFYWQDISTFGLWMKDLKKMQSLVIITVITVYNFIL